VYNFTKLLDFDAGLDEKPVTKATALKKLNSAELHTYADLLECFEAGIPIS
jgi:hypothetical protein